MDKLHIKYGNLEANAEGRFSVSILIVALFVTLVLFVLFWGII